MKLAINFEILYDDSAEPTVIYRTDQTRMLLQARTNSDADTNCGEAQCTTTPSGQQVCKTGNPGEESRFPVKVIVCFPRVTMSYPPHTRSIPLNAPLTSTNATGVCRQRQKCNIICNRKRSEGLGIREHSLVPRQLLAALPIIRRQLHAHHQSRDRHGSMLPFPANDFPPAAVLGVGGRGHVQEGH